MDGGHALRRSVDDAREELGPGAKRAVDGGFAAELPDVRAVMQDGYLEIEPVSRGDRPAELRLVDAEEVHERVRRVERLARVREDSADLRERLDDEHARHDGAGGEGPPQPPLAPPYAPWTHHSLARPPPRPALHHHL